MCFDIRSTHKTQGLVFLKPIFTFTPSIEGGCLSSDTLRAKIDLRLCDFVTL